MVMKNEFITLKSRNLEVTFSTLGAGIHRILFDGIDMLMTPVNDEDYLKPSCYYGKTIGRICGRIAVKNQFGYQLQGNEKENSLHGGFDGISTKIFDYKKQDNKVIFTYLSKDGEAGYPGNLNLEVEYELTDSTLLVRFFAKVDKPCVVALTNHAYFSMGEKSTNDLKLKMDIDKFLDVDDKLMPIKYIETPKELQGVIQLSDKYKIDNYFLLKNPNISLIGKKYQMDIESDFLGTVIFSDNWRDNIVTTLSDKGIYRGAAIEPQDDQMDRKVLQPNQEYRKFIKYTFKKL